MTTNPRFVTRPPKADKRRDRKRTPAPMVGKPLSVDEKFRTFFGGKR